MENKLALSPVESTPGVRPPSPTPAPMSRAAEMQDDVADLRLVIDRDPRSGQFIYKTINRRTGDVILQLPREDVVRMHAEIDYRAGAVIKIKT